MFIFGIEKKYFFAALALTITICCVTLNGKQGPYIELYDYWEHAACINELSKDLFHPENPLLQTSETNTLRYTPYIFVAAAFKKIFQLGLFSTLTLISIVSFLIFLSGVYLWSRAYFRDPTIPLYILITFLFFWGKPFNYSNEYSLRFLTYTLFYPSIITFNLSFVGLYLVTKYTRTRNNTYFIFYLLLATFIFMSHPLTGTFFLLCSFVLFSIEGSNRLRNSILYVFTLIVITALSLIWPYHSFIESVIKSTATDWYFPFRNYLYQPDNIYRAGPALLGLIYIPFYILYKKDCFIALGGALCVCVYVGSYILDIRLGERYIFFIICFLHLSIALHFSQIDLFTIRSAGGSVTGFIQHNAYRFFLWGIVCICITHQCAILCLEQFGFTLSLNPLPSIQRYTDPLDSYSALIGNVDKDNIVLSDPLTSWLLPALTETKIIALYHNNPMVPDNNIRIQDVKLFYSSKSSIKDRMLILNKYKASHVLLNYERTKINTVNSVENYHQDYPISDGLINDMRKLGTIVWSNDTMILFKINEPFTKR